MRLLLAVTTTALLALVLSAPAGAALWLDLDRSAARPGEIVHGRAVSPCSLCGARLLYFVDAAESGLQLLKTLPMREDRRYVPVGHFTWELHGAFSFKVPSVRRGTYQPVAFYRTGHEWTAAPASTVVRVRRRAPERP